MSNATKAMGRGSSNKILTNSIIMGGGGRNMSINMPKIKDEKKKKTFDI